MTKNCPYTGAIPSPTKSILNSYWTKENGKNVSKIKKVHEYEFQENMYKCQIELIRYYFHTMSREVKARALKTIKKVENKLALY